MNPQQATPYQEQLLTMRTGLLAQIAEQRGGVVSRAEVAADHFGRPEDSSAQLATEREVEFALGERETAVLQALHACTRRQKRTAASPARKKRNTTALLEIFCFSLTTLKVPDDHFSRRCMDGPHRSPRGNV